MIGYTTLGTNDLDRACRFYDPLFAEMGQALCWRENDVACWGNKTDPLKPRFFIVHPIDDNPASVGNGAMVALLIDSAARIDRLFAIALEHGGISAGDPGPRRQYGPGFYAAYVRDLDGNKIAFVCYDGAP